MQNAIPELITLLPLPAEPLMAVGDWGKVEAELGTGLPNDYNSFCHITDLTLYVISFLSSTHLILRKVIPFRQKCRAYSTSFRAQVEEKTNRKLPVPLFSGPQAD